MSETPNKPRTHPWRAWQPGQLASKNLNPPNEKKFNKGAKQYNRAG